MEESILEKFKRSIADALVQQAYKLSDANTNMLSASVLLGEKHDLLAERLEAIMSHDYLKHLNYDGYVNEKFAEISQMYEYALDILDDTITIDSFVIAKATDSSPYNVCRISFARKLLEYQRHNHLIYKQSLKVEFRALSEMRALTSRMESILNTQNASQESRRPSKV